jgi:hypothetical protein
MTREKYFSNDYFYDTKDIRTFSGMKYKLAGEYRSKEQAVMVAKGLKLSGGLARVVKQAKNVGWGRYAVYVTVKRKYQK